MGRAHYYSRMAVAPDDADEAYFLTASFSKSIDGGAHARRLQGGDAHRAATTTTSGSIRPTPTARSSPTTRGSRSRRTAAQTWYRQRLTQRADLSRHRRQRDSLQRARQQAGRADRIAARATAGCYGGRRRRHLRAACGTRSAAARAAGRRPIPTDSNIVWSTASGSGMVGGIVVRFEENRRQFRNVEVWPHQSNGPAEGVQLPLRLGRAAAHLAARQQHDLRRQPARAPHAGRRPELAGDPPGPHAQRPLAAWAAPAA